MLFFAPLILVPRPLPQNDEANDIIPVVSIVVPFFGLINQVYIKDYIRYPQTGTTMETIGIAFVLLLKGGAFPARLLPSLDRHHHPVRGPWAPCVHAGRTTHTSIAKHDHYCCQCYFFSSCCITGVISPDLLASCLLVTSSLEN